MGILRQLLCAIVVCSWALEGTNGQFVDLTILHFNDINSQINMYEEGRPLEPGTFGGLLRLLNLLQTNSTGHENVLRIAAGNLVGGTNGYLSILEWSSFGDLVKYYNPTIMGLGLKEFESGLPRTNEYLEKWGNSTQAKVLISNVNCDPYTDNTTAEYTFCSHVQKSRMVDIQNGEFTIGVVGFVNPLAERLSDPGDLKFEDVASSLTTTVNNDLKDAKTVIAVGSGSMTIAKQILDRVDKIKVVVLSGGTTELEPKDYPYLHNGKFIVRAESYGRSVGKLLLRINTGNGDVTQQTGTGLIRNNGLPLTDPSVVGPVNTMIKTARNISQGHVGTSLVRLEGTRDKCWKAECNLGNLVADAMVNCALRKLKLSSFMDLIGVWTSGSIFDDEVPPGREVTLLDVHRWLPYHNRVYKVSMTGGLLKQVFETSGTAISAPAGDAKEWGQFLQVSSGIEVHYSTKGDLKSLRVHHINNSQPFLDEVDEHKTYLVVLPSFMAYGKSVYPYLKDPLTNRIDIGFDDDCLKQYIQGLEVVHAGFEQRITVSDEDGGGGAPCLRCKGSSTGTTVVLTLLIFILIVGVIFVGWKFVWPRIRQPGFRSSFP